MISVGIDVSKGKSTVCMMKPGGEVLSTPFEVLHTKSELLKLVQIIKRQDEEIRVIMEDTGHYHLPVATLLVDNGIFVCSVNSLRMKRYCSQNIHRGKTDKIDSINIASYGITYWNNLIPMPPLDDTYRELQLLTRQYYQTIALIVKAKINFSNLLDRVMPNIQSILKDNSSNAKLTDFVGRYYHFSHILDMGEKRFFNDYCKWAKKKGHHMYEHKEKEIFALAQNGVSVLPNTQSSKIVVKEAVRLIHELELSRDTILAQMQTFAKTLPEYSVVKSMPCIVDTLAPRIIAEIGNVRRFKNKHSLIAYAGIDAPPYQSGKFNASERHISKRGNSYLRKTGYEIMQSLIKHKPENDAVYEFIEKKRLEGKCAKKAMIAGLNKFLRTYYGKVSNLYANLEHQQFVA